MQQLARDAMLAMKVGDQVGFASAVQSVDQMVSTGLSSAARQQLATDLHAAAMASPLGFWLGGTREQAVAFLTETNLRAIGKNLERVYPVEDTPAFAELLAAIDEALLELQHNDSWDLLPAMLQRRSYGVQTATAQLQVVGKRHYGRKAMPPGGGGGRALTRELLDTLLLWQPAVVLDANGSAQVEVPLNDALSGFRIVAVARSLRGRRI